MQEAAAAAMAVSVPYDVVLEILVRVKDVVTLFRCATTCKGLCRLLATEPSFLRRCLTEDVCRSAPFAGFFTERRLRRGFPSPCLVPAPRPVLDPSCRPLSFFFPNIGDRDFFDHAVPLASRHGLLLVRLDLCRAGIDRDPSGDLLAVCNLVAGTFDVLPRLEHNSEFHDHDVSGYTILTSKDCSSYNEQDQERLSFFKVLVIGIRRSEDATQYRLRTFSSAGEPRWNMCASSVQGSHSLTQLWQHTAVVSGGMARWLLWGFGGAYTVNVNVETNHFSLTRFNEVRNQMYPKYVPYISDDTEGRPVLFFLEWSGPKLEIWTLHNNWIWRRTRELTLKQLNQHKETPRVSYTCLGAKSGTLLVEDSYQHLYFVDAMTGVMHEVKNWPRRCNLSRNRTVPFDMDWPAFLLSRLGKLRSDTG